MTHGYPWSFTMSRPAHSIERCFFFQNMLSSRFSNHDSKSQLQFSNHQNHPFWGEWCIWCMHDLSLFFEAFICSPQSFSFRSLRAFGLQLHGRTRSHRCGAISCDSATPALVVERRRWNVVNHDESIAFNFASIMNLCVLAICTAFSNAISHEGYPLKFCSSAIFLENESGQIDCCYHGLSSFPLSHWTPNIPGLPCLKHQSCHHLACML